MPFQLNPLWIRLFACSGLLAAGSFTAPLLATVGITAAAGGTLGTMAAAGESLGTMLAGVMGGIVANDIGSISDSLGKNQGILVNHDLTKAVGQAISAIILKMAKSGKYDQHSKALKKVATVAAKSWEMIIVAEQKEKTNRYQDLTENKLAERFFHPETPVFDVPTWEHLLQDWFLELAQVQLDEPIRQAVAQQLHDEFSMALRETFAHDFQNGGKAFAKLMIDLSQQLYYKLSQQNAAISKQIQQLDVKFDKFDQLLSQLQRWGRLQPGTPQTVAQFQHLGRKLNRLLTEVRGIKADTVAIRKAVQIVQQAVQKLEQKQPEMRVVVEVQYPQPSLIPAPPPPQPPKQKRPTVGLETIAEIPVWVGRDEILNQLKNKLLSANPPKVLAIIGQGGMGKTSLAVKLIEALGVQLQPPELTADCPYEKVLYFKAYPGSSFESVAEFLLRGLEIETAEPLKTAAAKISKIFEGLNQQRSLLLLDNLEDILHPAHHADKGKAVSEEWRQLLNALVYANHGSTTILTSRELPADLADPRARNPKPDPKLVEVKILPGVADAAGVEILRQCGSEDSEADKRWIAERVKGNTFILTQLAAIGSESPGYLRKHPELVTEEAEPILQAQLQRHNTAAQELLRRMCVLRVEIDLEGLTFLRLYTKQDYRFEKAIASGKPAELTHTEIKETQAIIWGLVNSSLVQRRYDKVQCCWYYDLHRLTVEYLQAQYQAELPQLMERVYKFYCTGKTVDNPKTLADLRPVLEAQYFAFQLENYSEAFSLLNSNLHQFVYPWGYWNLLLDLYQQILPHITNNTDRRITWQRIGRIYRNMGNWDEAEKYFQKSLANARERNQKNGVALSLGLLGDIEKKRGNWDAAEQLYRQSLELRTELGDRNGIAKSWSQLGDIEKKRGNWDAAEQLYRQSLELRTELGDRAEIAMSWTLLGEIERKRGNWEAAKQLYHQSLKLRTELGYRAKMAVSWTLLGEIECKRGNWDAAEQLHRQALEIFTELGDRAGIAEIKMNLGENELGRGNLDTAKTYLTEALAQMEQLGMTWDIAETNFCLAQLWRKRGNLATAQPHYDKAYQIYQQLGAAKDLERIEQAWQSGDNSL